MRLQLALALAIAAGTTTTAHADGSVTLRGVYYKERATRVMQPMLDGMFEVGARGLLNTHLLVDAITSASASAGAADAVAFTENRYEAGLGYTHQLENLKLGAEAKYSTESDYKSLYVGGRGEAEFAQKNTTVGLGGGISRDEISGAGDGGLGQQTLACEPDAAMEQTECNLNTYALFGSASQILSRQAMVGLSIDIAKLSGYQSNPYRTAIAGDELVSERHPIERTRQAFAGLLRYYVKRTETTFVGAYRYYRDSWKVHGHTPELRIIQQIADLGDAAVRYRYHTQDGAFFYRERYATPDGIGMTINDLCPEGCVSDDVKLSSTSTHLMEAKLGITGEAFGLEGRWAGARFEGILQYVVQYNRFGNAIIAHFGVTVPLDY
jgi:hypothetical protein